MSFSHRNRPSSTVPNLDDLENYVYESHGGDGAYIYHVEEVILTARNNSRGVQLNSTLGNRCNK